MCSQRSSAGAAVEKATWKENDLSSTTAERGGESSTVTRGKNPAAKRTGSGGPWLTQEAGHSIPPRRTDPGQGGCLTAHYGVNACEISLSGLGVCGHCSGFGGGGRGNPWEATKSELKAPLDSFTCPTYQQPVDETLKAVSAAAMHQLLVGPYVFSFARDADC